MDEERATLLAHTADIVVALASSTSHTQVPGLIASTYAALAAAGAPLPEPVADPVEHIPAVSVRKSLASPDHIVSMIDGQPYKMLTRHIGKHGLTPATYRERYRLPADYPMVAPTYSAQRAAMAKASGLGTKKQKEA